MALRWPFHIYHGAWATLPWAMLWGGSYAVAFLYLRRLAPLVAFHAAYDAYIGMQSAYGDAASDTVLIVGAILVLALALRITPDRRRRLNPAAPTGDAATARYVLFRGERRNPAILAGGAIAGGAIIAVEISLAPDATTKLILVLLIALTIGVIARVLWSGGPPPTRSCTATRRWSSPVSSAGTPPKPVTPASTPSPTASTNSPPSAPSPGSTATPSSSETPKLGEPDWRPQGGKPRAAAASAGSASPPNRQALSPRPRTPAPHIPEVMPRASPHHRFERPVAALQWRLNNAGPTPIRRSEQVGV
jgi:hypothetical protein